MVEGPLVPVDHLRRLTRTDVDQLGQVDLVGAAMVAEHEVERYRGSSGWVTRVRALGERAIRAPVRRVAWPKNSVCPALVAAMCGSSSVK